MLLRKVAVQHASYLDIVFVNCMRMSIDPRLWRKTNTALAGRPFYFMVAVVVDTPQNSRQADT